MLWRLLIFYFYKNTGRHDSLWECHEDKVIMQLLGHKLISYACVIQNEENISVCRKEPNNARKWPMETTPYFKIHFNRINTESNYSWSAFAWILISQFNLLKSYKMIFCFHRTNYILTGNFCILISFSLTYSSVCMS